MIFDTETTGLDPSTGDRIVEIAAVRFKGKDNLGQFHSLVNPCREISPRAFEVNKISPDMLEGAPKMELILPRFLDFIQGACLCSYNLPFDLGFINKELEISGSPPLTDLLMVDILAMARKLLPKLERHALWFVAQNMGIETKQEHRAFSDVELAWKVFGGFKVMLQERGIEGFSGFLSLFGFSLGHSRTIKEQKIAKIEEAIELGVKLKIKYFSHSSSLVTERIVLPKEVKIGNKQVYLVGFCSLRNEERSFKIENILELEIV